MCERVGRGWGVAAGRVISPRTRAKAWKKPERCVNLGEEAARDVIPGTGRETHCEVNLSNREVGSRTKPIALLR